MANSSKERTIRLETLAGGAAVERFNDELQAVLKNVIDPNTSHKTKRRITLTVELMPNEERTSMNIGVKCESKLAPPKAVESFGYIGVEKNGEVVATEYNPRQPVLPMIDRSGRVEEAG